MWKLAIIPLFAVAVILSSAEYAAAFEPTEKGKFHTNEFIRSLPDGSQVWQWSSHPERILDGNQYKDYILFQDANIVRLETANAGSLVFNKNSCSYNFYNGGYIDELNTAKIKNISWTVKGKEASASTWSNLNGINNAACTVSVQTTEETVKITGSKTNTSGTFQIVLDYAPGKGIKETMRGYNNNPAWNNHNIGFTETFEVPRVIHFGAQQYDLANYNGTTLGRTWIENNEAKLVRLSDRIHYDFGIGFDQLDNIKITWDGTTAKLSLNYLFTNTIVPYQTWFEVDPTFGYTTGTMGTPRSTGAVGAACPGAPFDNPADGIIQVPRSTDAATCRRNDIQWDTTSISDSAIITAGTIRYDITGIGANPRNCNWNSIEFQPSTRTAAERFADIADGTTYLSNNADCTTVANDKTWTLPAAARTDIMSKLSANWWAIGVLHTDQTRDANVHDQTFSTVELQLTYVSSPPNPASALTATSQARKVQYSWTQTNGTGVTTYYLGRSLDNSTWPAANKTSVGNVTSYLDSAVYRAGLLYYVNITASNGLNATATYSSFTMDDIPSAVQNLSRTLVNSTTVKLNWTPPSSTGGDAISGYRVERSTGYTCTGSFSVLVNSTTALNYNNTGLSTTQQYCYRVAAWNGVGLSPYSNNVLRFALPDPINDLSITAVGLTNIDIAWSTPGLNGGTLSGYQVNYTTPSGTPLTIISNNTLSAATAYSVTGLTQDTSYCFRVGAWTEAGTDPDGNIECTTTYVLANFTIGFFDVNSTNPEQVPIRYERSELNATATNVKVIYPNSADLDCLLDFSFAQTQESYENITGDAYDVDQDYEDFVFANAGNDIITIDCTNSNNNDTARYVVTQDGTFVLLEMIRNFRSGEYGTMGFIGSLDLITVLVVIISMIGFNRVSGQVGIIFNIFLIGVASYFEIIAFDWIWLPQLVLIAMVVILSTRKD